jgi:hypothetical protein
MKIPMESIAYIKESFFKVHVFLEGHKNMTKISKLFLRLVRRNFNLKIMSNIGGLLIILYVLCTLSPYIPRGIN